VSTSIISLTDLCFSYDGRGQFILRDLSLKIAEAAVTAILGPNGSGKTTLLSLILGIRSPQQGTIRIQGRDLRDYSRSAMSRLIGLVPQDETFPLGLSVFHYVLLGRAPYRGLLESPKAEDVRAASEAIETVGLTDFSTRLVSSLSGGERQLAVVARALAQDPHVLLMDEPTSHLDLSNRSHLAALIRNLAARGVTVILTTHDPNVAARVANDAVLMRRGEVLASGPVEEVLNASNLTATYGVPVQVAQVYGKTVIVVP
jgi:iron complex transport system ATP-binding protein